MARRFTEKDGAIVSEIQRKYGDLIRIGRDILNEPCILIAYRGPWDIVYKLSASGDYQNTLYYYCVQVDNAIQQYIKDKDTEYKKRQTDAAKEAEYYKKFEKQRKTFETRGFKDDLPETQEG